MTGRLECVTELHSAKFREIQSTFSVLQKMFEDSPFIRFRKFYGNLVTVAA